MMWMQAPEAAAAAGDPHHPPVCQPCLVTYCKFSLIFHTLGKHPEGK